MLYFDIQNLFWHSKSGRISYFDIRNPILTFELGPNIVFWPSNWGRISYFYMQNPILTFKMGPNIVFWHKNQILTFKMGPNTVFWHSKSYSDIPNRAEYRILTLKILFLHVKLGRIYHILTFQNPTLSFELMPNIVFWNSKSYFGIRNWAEVALWHSKSYFEIRKWAQYHILTFKIIFGIRTEAEYRTLTFKILSWHSKSGRISYNKVKILWIINLSNLICILMMVDISVKFEWNWWIPSKVIDQKPKVLQRGQLRRWRWRPRHDPYVTTMICRRHKKCTFCDETRNFIGF